MPTVELGKALLLTKWKVFPPFVEAQAYTPLSVDGPVSPSLHTAMRSVGLTRYDGPRRSGGTCPEGHPGLGTSQYPLQDSNLRPARLEGGCSIHLS